MQIAPSLLSADFANLASELKDIENGGADIVHLDVMDGHFVPNLTFGAPVIQALRAHTSLPFDVHLMTYHPENYFDALEAAGASMISFHAEASIHKDRTIRDIRKRGIQAGLALNPGTSLSAVEELLPILDFVLVMSVNPGFGGQSFIDYTLDKIRKLRSMADMHGRKDLIIEVDGGVSVANIGQLSKAGVDIAVAGSSVFGKSDRSAAIAVLKNTM